MARAGATAGPRAWLLGYAAMAVAVGALPGLAVLSGLLVVLGPVRGADSLAGAAWAALPWLPLATLVGYAVLALLIVALVRALSFGMSAGVHPVRSGAGICIWGTFRVLDDARAWLFPLYSSALTPTWLRLLGARIGEGVEASTVLLLPKFASVNDHAFLADDTLIGCYELGGGWVRVEDVKIGKRAFVGNSGMAAAGRKVPKASLVAVLSAAPRRSVAKAGTSWLGSPPTRLRRAVRDQDDSRTYAPPRRLRTYRGLVEAARVVPVILAVLLGASVGLALLALLAAEPWVAIVLGGPVLLVGGVAAALVTAAAKWAIVGRHRPSEHPLWSGFVWRNELADTFTEVLAAPWFASVTQGTVALNVWLRLLGARIGTGVWCDTYWLPRPTWSSCTTAARSTTAASSRHTSSTTGARHGCGRAEGGCDPGTQQRYPSRRDDRASRHGGSGIARHAGGRCPQPHSVDREPGRAVGGPREMNWAG